MKISDENLKLLRELRNSAVLAHNEAELRRAMASVAMAEMKMLAVKAILAAGGDATNEVDEATGEIRMPARQS